MNEGAVLSRCLCRMHKVIGRTTSEECRCVLGEKMVNVPDLRMENQNAITIQKPRGGIVETWYTAFFCQ